MAVIGLDGVGLPLVRDLMARDVMPNFARLVAGGTLAPMRSSIPTISSVSWTNFVTGRNPGKHGIYGFTDVKPGTLSLFFPNFGNVAGDTLWDVAGRAGRRAVVLNIPGTYPARAMNGLLVSGFVAVKLERAVHPPELLPRLQAEGYKIDVDYMNADQRPEAFFTDLMATLEARRRVYCRLAREEPWDLFVGVITECDRLHHYFWNQWTDPAAPHHGRFLDFYRLLDDVLGDLVAALPGDVPLFVVADHGHTLIHRVKTFREGGRQLGIQQLADIGDIGERHHDDYVREANRLVQQMFVEQARGSEYVFSAASAQPHQQGSP